MTEKGKDSTSPAKAKKIDVKLKVNHTHAGEEKVAGDTIPVRDDQAARMYQAGKIEKYPGCTE